MKVIIVGSGGAALTKERSCPCVVVDDKTILDCGSGSLKNLCSLDVKLEGIERTNTLIAFRAYSKFDLVNMFPVD